MADSPIGAMPGGHGCPAVTGSGAPPTWNCRSAAVTVLSPAAAAVPVAASGAAGRVTGPASAARTAIVLSWARAVRTVCRQIESQVRAWVWSQPRVSFPVLKVSSIGHR